MRNWLLGTPGACGPFGSRNVAVHLARGAAGAAGIACALALRGDHPMLAGALVAASIASLRGCPMCWMIGPVETIAAAIRHRRPSWRSSSRSLSAWR